MGKNKESCAGKKKKIICNTGPVRMSQAVSVGSLAVLSQCWEPGLGLEPESRPPLETEYWYYHYHPQAGIDA